MSVNATPRDHSLATFLAEVRSLWGDGKDPELPYKVKGLLEKLMTSINPQRPWISNLIKQGLSSKELYRDQDHSFILMGHMHAKGYGVSPHDHGPCWVLYGVTVITTYRRTDDGKVP